MNIQDPTLSHVVERDLDLLLVEELSCSPTFQVWFFSQVEPGWEKQLLSEIRVRHSVTGSGPGSGETDIHVSARVGKERVHLHLENKIHSPFTENQPQRYQQRAAAARDRAECDAFRCVLLCPAGYAPPGNPVFDRVVVYEKIAEFLRARSASVDGELKARLLHRCQIVEQAIGRFRRGYVPKPVVEVTDIWQAYYSIASADYPDLGMPPPGEKPGDSYSVSFFCLAHCPPLPKCRIEHVMEQGTVTLLMPGLAQIRVPLAAAMNSALPDGAFLRDAGKSLGITIKVTEVRRMKSANSQVTAMRQALDAARSLKRWYDENLSAVRGVIVSNLSS